MAEVTFTETGRVKTGTMEIVTGTVGTNGWDAADHININDLNLAGALFASAVPTTPGDANSSKEIQLLIKAVSPDRVIFATTANSPVGARVMIVAPSLESTGGD